MPAQVYKNVAGEVADVLAKYKIKPSQWDLFLRIAASNMRVPHRDRGESNKGFTERVRSWIKQAPSWAYLGGMKDALWAWVNADREAFFVLETALLKVVKKTIPPAIQEELTDAH